MNLPAPLPERWNPTALWRLVWPIVVEQFLAVTIGMADTIMVTSAGEAAVSGISLVDAINILLITLFSALATGGAVVVSQYIGRREHKEASLAAKHLIYSITAASLVLMLVALVLRVPLLRLIYGHIAPDVMQNAETYFWISAISYPFLALYNAGAALFRSMGNSKVSMLTSILVNIINIGGNALLIFGFGWGVAGAATASLVSRMVAAVVVVWLLMRKTTAPVSLTGLFHYERAPGMVKRIFRIGAPNGLENSMFQIGKLLVARIVSAFGTSAIAANAIAMNLSTFVNLTGMAIGMAMLTVVGQCVGAGDYAGARKATSRLMKAAHLVMAAVGGVMLLLANPLLGLFNLTPEAVAIARQCVLIFCLCAWVFWPPSFALPNALRAAGDARYTMLVSVFSMWTFRIGASFLFAYTFGLGVLGVWVAMVVDWLVRDAFFLVRWRSGKWQQKRLIK